MPTVVKGRYELIRELGAAADESEAWVAQDTDGYSYLVKLWRFEGPEPDPVRRALWDEELRTLYRVASSPGAEQSVLCLRDATVDRQVRAFVMVLEGAGYSRLTEVLARPSSVPWLGPRSVRNRARLWCGLRSIATGLRLLHGQHVLHRVVDARNVFIDPAIGVESIRLGGFEWSIRMGSPSSRRVPFESWATPPEMFTSRAGYQPETDWFGFGTLAGRFIMNLEDLDGREPVNRHAELVRRIKSAGAADLSPVEAELLLRLVAQSPADRLVHFEDIIASIDEAIAALTTDPGERLADATFILVVDPNKDWLLDAAVEVGFVLDPADRHAVFNPRNTYHVSRLTSFLRERLDRSQVFAMEDGGTYALLGALRPLRIGQFTDSSRASSWDMAFCIGPCEIHSGPTSPAGVRLPPGSVQVRTVSQAHRERVARQQATSWDRVLPRESRGTSIGGHLADLLDFLRTTNQIDLIIRDAEIFPYTAVSHSDNGVFEYLTIRESTRESAPPRWCQVEGGLAQFLGNELATNKPDCEIVVLSHEASLSLGSIERQGRWSVQRINDDGSVELMRPWGTDEPPPDTGFLRTWGMAAGQIPLIRRRSDAIERLAGHSYLLQALTAPGRVYMDTGEADLGVELPVREVDKPKRACIEDVLRVRPIYALQGPPGTGKTTMVAWLLREILSDDPVAQILVTAQAHSAVDVLRRRVSSDVFADLPQEEKPLAVRLRPDERPGEEGSVEAVTLEILKRAAEIISRRAKLTQVQQAWSVEVDQMIRALESLEAANTAPDFCQVVRRAANLTYCTTSAGDLEIIAQENQSFDWSIVEEAGKAHGFDLALPLQAGHRWLLIGDHEQLPPYRYGDYLDAIKDIERTMERLAEIRPRAGGLVDLDLFSTWEDKPPEEKSRFQQYASSRLATFHQVFRQCGTAPGTVELMLTADTPMGAAAGMLSGQHRMHPDIGELISEVFYGGKVENRTVADDGSPLPRVLHGFRSPEEVTGKAIVWLDLPSAMSDPAFGEVGPRQGMPRYSNPREAETLARFLERLDGKHGGGTLSFAALSPYNRQVQKLRDVLKNVRVPHGLSAIADLRGREGLPESVRMSQTVDAFQGNQADVVAISLVRNNDLPKERGLGFLEERSRINVLLSRAERLLVLIGSWEFFVDQASLVDLDDETHPLWHWAKVTTLLDEWFRLGRAVRIDALKAGLAG